MSTPAHKLKITNGTSILAHSILHVPETFRTPSELILAAGLIEKIDAPAKAEDTKGWADENSREISLSEKERDLLKSAVEKHSSKLSPNRWTTSLLMQLGFE